MDLLKTLLLYMAMVYASSVQNVPDVQAVLESLATPTPVVEATPTPTPVPTPTPTPVPTIDIVPNPDYKTLRVGDKGDDVIALQQKLAEYGYYTGDIDGRYGNQTRRAVERFQYNHGLLADGIAGKNTLTVLYDSNQVRFADATPAPTQTSALVAAATPPASATPAPTFVPLASATPTPSPSPAPTASPSVAPAATGSAAPAAATAAPTATPEPKFLPMDGWKILIGEKTEPLSRTAVNGTLTPIAPYALGDTMYVPLIGILQQNGNALIPADSLERMEYAFVIDENIYRLSYTEDQAGNPTDLMVYKNNQPQLLPLRDVRLGDNYLYFPAESVTSLTGVSFERNDGAKTVTVSFPKPAEG